MQVSVELVDIWVLIIQCAKVIVSGALLLAITSTIASILNARKIKTYLITLVVLVMAVILIWI